MVIIELGQVTWLKSAREAEIVVQRSAGEIAQEEAVIPAVTEVQVRHALIAAHEEHDVFRRDALGAG